MHEPIRVGQLCLWLKDHLEEHFPAVAVVGEITGFKRQGQAGHLYFELKEKSDRVACTCWRSTAARLRFEPQDGLQVVVHGRITYYGPHAKLQINVSSMQPIGIGAAELEKQQLLEKLRKLGWFDRRKKPLPVFPRRVALLTSVTGAAVRDMIQSFAKRWPSCELVVKHSSVQGERAPFELAAGLKELNAMHASARLQLDAIIVGRGGGSAEDLKAFDAELTAQAIYESIVPVVAAVGHETDVTIADLVADARSETPSNAVTMLTPDPEQMITEFHRTKKRMQMLLHSKCSQGRQRLDFLAKRPVFERPFDRLRRAEQQIDGLHERLKLALQRRLQQYKQKLASASARLQSVSPLHVLGRGYSVTRDASGTVLRDAAALKPGDEIVTTLARGEVSSTVSKTSS